MKDSSAITLEIVPPDAPESKELLAIIETNGASIETAQSLQQSFAPLFKQAYDVIKQSRSIEVKDAGEKLKIKLAHECRMALRKIRIEGEETKDTLKEE